MIWHACDLWCFYCLLEAVQLDDAAECAAAVAAAVRTEVGIFVASAFAAV